MKRCSFKVAKAIKEAGYPQEWHETEYYYTVSGELKHCDNYEGNNVEDIMFYQRNAVPAPFAMEVWLWLWRERKYHILFSASNQRWNEVHGIVTGTDGEVCASYRRGTKTYDATDHNANYSDPEEAIVAAIEYLVTNNLIK